MKFLFTLSILLSDDNKESYHKGQDVLIFDKFSLLVPQEMYREQQGEYAFLEQGLKGQCQP